MADRIEEVQVQLEVRNIRSHGPMASNQINSMQDELVHDLGAISEQWNSRLVPLTSGLPNGSEDASVDAFLNGLDGKHFYIDKDATVTVNSPYFNSSANRPNTLFEQLTDIYGSLSVLREDLESQIAGLIGQAAQISVEDIGNLYNSNNVEDALSEVMTQVNQIALSGVTPDLSAVNQHYIPIDDNTYDIGSAVKRMRDVYVGPGSVNILAKSVEGEAPTDKVFTLGVDAATGKLQLMDGASLVLEALNSELTCRQTFKTNTISAGPSSSDINFVLSGGTVKFTDTTVSMEGITAAFRHVRVTTVERNALTLVDGIVVFNTDSGRLETYNGSGWYASSDTITTQSDLILSVDPGGSDTPTPSRPEILYGGDYSAYPFASIQAALDSLEKNRSVKTDINIAAGNYDGFRLEGHTHRQLTMTGEMGTPIGPFTVSTPGANQWEWNVGSVSWTPGAFRGYLITVLSGLGAGKTGIIMDNGTSSIEVNAPFLFGFGATFTLTPIATHIDSIPAGADYTATLSDLTGVFVFRQLAFDNTGSTSPVVSLRETAGATCTFETATFDVLKSSYERTSIIALHVGVLTMNHTYAWEWDFELGTSNWTWYYDSDLNFAIIPTSNVIRQDIYMWYWDSPWLVDSRIGNSIDVFGTKDWTVNRCLWRNAFFEAITHIYFILSYALESTTLTECKGKVDVASFAPTGQVGLTVRSSTLFGNIFHSLGQDPDVKFLYGDTASQVVKPYSDFSASPTKTNYIHAQGGSSVTFSRATF